MRCLSCKYDLRNLAGPPHRCPECGREFDPNDPATFAPRKRLTIKPWHLIACLAFLLFLLSNAIVNSYDRMQSGNFSYMWKWAAAGAFDIALIVLAVYLFARERRDVP